MFSTQELATPPGIAEGPRQMVGKGPEEYSKSMKVRAACLHWSGHKVSLGWADHFLLTRLFSNSLGLESRLPK